MAGIKVLRSLKDWTLSFAQSPRGTWALFFLALAEASFFPIPPDVLLIALCLAAPKRSLYFALICTSGSVLGGLVGYALGAFFMETIGRPVLVFYGLTDKFDLVSRYFHQYDAWAVGVAGFTPLPYKLFTISAGAFRIDLLTFFLASTISRAGRFFLIAGSIFFFGEMVKHFIERYFNLLTVVFIGLLILGFVVIKWLL
ncbi:DedA family protein [Thermosulfuriphilus ammonigenes]|uniref:DedA family protein n=1 Tax=Thermosulfuriphilus ammonigenes TaxID=1936021 RepID=A0A6G7PWS9_9BACT|nr:YqaA family protein [Thermosulfuriphilus ammonigenes]MBA2847679.1 membrane protein YqaA with SNARE-associated domain [Thermosulfuriphilus ammonigenes]QIJ72112.1 DedA family protein [Thermosulfuriphilus ammonigenes]